MLEEEANKMAIATLPEMGTRQGWHKPYVRFGSNTIKTFGAESEPGIRLGEDDIYFVDIGPVWEKYEGDAGETFVTGNNPEMKRCSQDVILNPIYKEFGLWTKRRLICVNITQMYCRQDILCLSQNQS